MSTASTSSSADQDLELADQFQNIQDELVRVQNELSSVVIAGATNPILEQQLLDRQRALAEQRDKLLHTYGAIALTWILRGGKVRFAHGSPSEAPKTKEAPPASANLGDTLKALRSHTVPAPEKKRVVVSKTTTSTPAPAPEDDVDAQVLMDVLVQLGRPPGPLSDNESLWDEVYRMVDATGPINTKPWADFPKEVQKGLVGMVVSRSRHIQDEIDDAFRSSDLDAELDQLFSSMTAFSKREQPGFVFGLQRHHHPVTDSWAGDALRWWEALTARLPDPGALNPERAIEALSAAIEAGKGNDEVGGLALSALDAGVANDDPVLLQIIAAYPDQLKKHSKFKRVRKALRAAEEADQAWQDETNAAKPPKLTKSSALSKKLVGKTVAVVCGPMEADHRTRLADAFGFTAVEWIVDADALSNLPRVIRSGSVDVVVSLRRFVAGNGDASADSAAKGAGVPFAPVEGAYTVAAIKTALEAVV